MTRKKSQSWLQKAEQKAKRAAHKKLVLVSLAFTLLPTIVLAVIGLARGTEVNVLQAVILAGFASGGLSICIGTIGTVRLYLANLQNVFRPHAATWNQAQNKFAETVIKEADNRLMHHLLLTCVSMVGWLWVGLTTMDSFSPQPFGQWATVLMWVAVSFNVFAAVYKLHVAVSLPNPEDYVRYAETEDVKDTPATELGVDEIRRRFRK